MKRNNPIDTIQEFIKNIIAAASLESLTEETSAEEIANTIYVEVVDSLVKDSILENEQDEFIKLLSEKAEEDRTAFLDQLSKLGDDFVFTSRIIEKTAEIIGELLGKLHESGEIDEETMKELGRKISDPTNDIYDIGSNVAKLEEVQNLEELNTRLSKNTKEGSEINIADFIVNHIKNVFKILGLEENASRESILKIADVISIELIEEITGKKIGDPKEMHQTILKIQKDGNLNRELITEHTIQIANKNIIKLIEKLREDGTITDTQLGNLQRFRTTKQSQQKDSTSS